MKTLRRFLVITALAATLSGCLGGAEPDICSHRQLLNTVDVASVPADLMSCDAFYGADWDTPDSILEITGRPGKIVLIQEGEMVCWGGANQLENRLDSLALGTFFPLSASHGSVGGEGGDFDLGGGKGADNPTGDSNPLPANPGGKVSGDNPAGDSNPLPANPGGEASTDNPEGDSNPLPARSEVVAQANSASDF